MSGGYLLSPLALADLSDIWDYSYSHWGADQADAYVACSRGRLQVARIRHQREVGYTEEEV